MVITLLNKYKLLRNFVDLAVIYIIENMAIENLV